MLGLLALAPCAAEIVGGGSPLSPDELARSKAGQAFAPTFAEVPGVRPLPNTNGILWRYLRHGDGEEYPEVNTLCEIHQRGWNLEVAPRHSRPTAPRRAGC
jgi:hypothetical protein